jgi:predicted nucleotidyltransferase
VQKHSIIFRFLYYNTPFLQKEATAPIQISSFSKVPSFLFVIDYCFAACYSIMSERGAFMDEIEIIKQKLIEQVNPICIYLFGSFARGTAHADSDLDFYIIVDDGEKDLHAVAASAYKAIRDVKQRPMDILVGTKSGFDERKDQFTVENEVFHKGILIYESGR